jgi:hypothetical protein
VSDVVPGTPHAWISESPMFNVVELTPVTVILRLVVILAGKLTVSPLDASLGREPKLTLVASEKVNVPEVIWSLRFGLS